MALNAPPWERGQHVELEVLTVNPRARRSMSGSGFREVSRLGPNKIRMRSSQ